ncbi:hypothetical protein [Sphaerotilus sp.]|uniref:hypothetical protein n=1 Tax=Sphaerotilus sp. TaxID=2093942 RepID=UPI002ACEC794|nr:hypothetical protein [Sphaerotilus sp.]MDZ7856725.1 hypothetical protein [Sphaerotilus sp.]
MSPGIERYETNEARSRSNRRLKRRKKAQTVQQWRRSGVFAARPAFSTGETGAPSGDFEALPLGAGGMVRHQVYELRTLGAFHASFYRFFSCFFARARNIQPFIRAGLRVLAFELSFSGFNSFFGFVSFFRVLSQSPCSIPWEIAQL